MNDLYRFGVVLGVFFGCGIIGALLGIFIRRWQE